MKTLDLSTLTLLKGNHTPDSQYCVMELSAYLAGESWSDAPECVSPAIAAFLRSWNDSLDNTDRQMLKPYAVTVIGTRTTTADETVRAWMATDWLTRTCAPMFLRLTPSLSNHADALESLPELHAAASAAASAATSAAARDAASDAAYDAARAAASAAASAAVRAAARDAAYVAVRAAARDAAYVAASDAAYDAVRDAAYVAASDAVRDAASAAAYDAVRAAVRAAASAAAYVKLHPTAKALQQSALQLLDRMIAVGKRDVPLAVAVTGLS